MSEWVTPSHWVHCDGLNPFNPDPTVSYHPAGWHDPKNCTLTRKETKLSKKDRRIKELEEEVTRLGYELLASENELEALQDDYLRAINYNNRAPEIGTERLYPELGVVRLLKTIKNHEPKYAGDIAFDFWPLRDWFRLSFKKFRPGQYAQLVVGPVRIEWYAA